MLMQDPEFASDVQRLIEVCMDRGIAVQTIKSVARRRWVEGDTQKHFSWYEPIKSPDALRRMVYWVLGQPNVFLNTSSDGTILPLILQAASEYNDPIDRKDLEHEIKVDALQLQMAPIFIRGIMDTI